MKTIITVSVLLVAGLAMYFFPHILLNPGQLVEGHQKIRESCTSCHTPFWGIDSDKCISCHKISEIGSKSPNQADSGIFERTLTLHKNLGSQSCTSCHSDHKGKKPDRSIMHFDHQIVSKVGTATCSNCHNKPQDNIHKLVGSDCNKCHSTEKWNGAGQFNHSMIQGKDSNNCISCHKTPTDNLHQQSSGACLSCHNTTKWLPANFEHNKYFRFDSNHPSDCKSCHQSSNFKEYTCYNCHAHSQSRVENKHERHGISNFNNCVRCHKSGNEHDMEGGEGDGEGEHDD